MNEFLQTALSFPTLVYSVLLAFCVIYWLLAASGLMDADGIDGLLGGDGEGDGINAVAAIVGRFGLGGVPIMLILTVLAFFGWTITYFVHLLVLQGMSGLLRYLLGAAVLALALVPGMLATSVLLRPLRRLIVRLRPPLPVSLLGKVGIVSTPTVSAEYGMASVDDGGAGLLLQIRAPEPNDHKRGDRVVLIEFIAAKHAYRVIPESKFQNL